MESSEVISSRTEKKAEKKYIGGFKHWKWVVSIFIIIAIIFIILSYYQTKHFNANITINGIAVGGLTAEEALEKLQSVELKNDIYIGDQLVLDGKNTKMNFTSQDLPAIEAILKEQWTFFPSNNDQSFYLLPSEEDKYRKEELKNELEKVLVEMNKELTPPKDATAILEDGEIKVLKSEDGKQWDVPKLLEEYDKHGYTSEIHLSSLYMLPIKEDSPIIEEEKEALQNVLDHTVVYKVQDKEYTLQGKDYIKNATVTKDLEVSIEPDEIRNKVKEINDKQSTLGKDFTFTTTGGQTITVPGEGYGWALDINKETALIQEAFEKGKESVSAENIIGNGWNGEGYGYEVTANNGIGNTYVEVSISEQRIWVYKDGNLVVTTPVVTGKKVTNQDTNKGVWYILFKRTNYTLTGQNAGTNYAVPVKYWLPFTNSGQGLHDADWRSSFGGDIYINNGSAGCVNVPPEVMKTVYNAVDVYQPVVIY